jgi:predicted nucleic acid-binding protein
MTTFIQPVRPTAVAMQPLYRKGRPPRVVIDNALVMAALMFGGGAPAALRRAWQAGRLRPLLCLATLYDLERRLSVPQLRLQGHERQQMVADYLPHALRVSLPGRLGRDAGAGHGDADEPPAMVMVRLAMAGRAHALVSADAELLALDGKLCCPVMSLDALLEQIPLRPRTQHREDRRAA